MFLSAASPAVDFSGVPGTVLDYHSLHYSIFHTAPDVFISDPEILVLSNGTYIASHALSGWDSGADSSGQTTIFRSTDQGLTWTSLGIKTGILRGSLFEFGGALYLMGTTYEGGTAVLMKSLDSGTSWTTANFSFSGPGTPNNPVVWSNRLWCANGTTDLSAPTDSNLFVEASWKSTGGFPAYVAGWPSEGSFIGEGQIAASPELGVFILPKVKDHALTALARVNSSGNVSFDPTNNFAALPGGEKKFGVSYDPVSSNFYLLSNPLLQTAPAYLPSTTSADPDMIRNTAVVLTSKDLLNWTVKKIFLYSGDIDHEGFGYLNFDFDGTNIAVAARTAQVIPGETSPDDGRGGHDSNCFTFHRINDFRNLLPDQYLKISGNNVLRFERTPDTKDNDVPLGPFTLGSTFAGAALTSPNGIGKTAAGDVYIQEAGGRILHFDPLGNFIETNSSAPVSLTATQINAKQPPAGECSWSRSTGGDWPDLLSWYYWGRPDTDEEIAVFGSAATAATTVNIPSATQIWNFNTADDKEGWTVANATNTAVSGGYLQGSANTTSNLVYIYRNDRFFYGSTVPEMRIRFRSDANCDVNFYWGTPQADIFSGTRKITLAYTGNGTFQELVFPLAGNAAWDGQAITRIRFDPIVHTNGANREFAVDYITVPKESCRLKGLRFRNAQPYTLGGTGQLRIEADSGTGTVEVLQGKHTNNVELVLGSDTDMVLTNNTSLHLKLGIDLNGKTLHVSGAGKLLMQDSLVMNGGTLALSGATPLTFTNNSTGAVLDGTLQFLPEGAFAPTNGTSFDLLDNPGVLGTKKFAAVSLPTLSAGLQWNTNSLYSTGSVSVETVQHTLIVTTPRGNAVPAAGTNTYNYGTNLTAALTNSPVVNGTTQYVCRGWSGTGSVPVSGTSTNTGSFTLTNNSTVIWLWTTNYWLDTATNGNGSVNISDGWKTNGASVQITAAPGTGWLFTAWSGNTNGCTISGNIITAPMTSARAITANFEVDPLSLPNTWQTDAAGSWTNPANWTDGIVPGISGGSNSADIVIFAATLTTNRIVTVDANRNIGGITFANPANLSGTNLATSVGYTLNGGNLILSSGGVIQITDQSGTNTSTIASPVTLAGSGGSATFRNDAAGNKAGLALAGAIAGDSTAGSTTTLYLDGVSTSVGINGNVRNNSISGVISDGTNGGRLAAVKNGIGLWTLTGANTFTGGFTFNAGIIRYFGKNATIFGLGGTVTINDGVTFNKGNNSRPIINNPMLVNGDFAFEGNSFSNIWSGPIDFAGGTRTLTISADLAISGAVSNGGLTKAGAGTLILSNANTCALGTAVSAGELIAAADGALGVSNVTVASGATLSLTNGASNDYINDRAALILAAASTLNLNFTGTDTVSGISLDGGTTWLPFGTYDTASLDALGTGTYAGSGSLMVEGFADDPANTPYSWLAQYGLTNFNADAKADVDGDGLLTWQEYVAGTNPTNPASVFKITGRSVNAQGTVIRWSSAPNKLYNLSRTTNLLTVFAAVAGATNLPATPPENVFTNSQNDGNAAFYRINVHQ
jgi:autotransporter-associated beta strand protein